MGTATIARQVLPVFRRQGAGHLVVVSSLLASVSAPQMGSYVAAKWGQQGLVRTLQQETRDVPGIHVSMVSPGGVSTPIYSQAGTWAGTTGRPAVPVYSSERVARAVVARLERPRRVVQAGLLNPVIIAGFRLLPGLYDALVGPLLRTLALAGDDAPPGPGNVFESRPEGNAVHGKWRGL
jgi:short-subunit dehydrogenase